MITWQEAASKALADAYPQTLSPAEIAEAIREAGVLAWSREGLSRWLKARAEEGTVDHVAFKQYRAGRAVMEPGGRHNHVTRDVKPQGQCPGCDQGREAPGKYAAPQVEAHLREDPDRGGLVVQVHVQHPSSKGVPYERHVPNLEAALDYIGTFWRHSAPGRDAASPPARGVEWGYRYRLLRHPSGLGEGRVTERCSASRAEADEDVAAFLEEPEKWAAEVIWRTAEVKPGEWHSLPLSMADALDKAGATAEDGEEVPPQVLSDLLLLADDTVIPPEVIATWASWEREAAAEWASAVRLRASDNPVQVPEQPRMVRRTAEICASPAKAQLAVEAWAAFKEPGEFTANWESVYEIAQDAITGLLALLGDDALDLAAKLGRS